MAEQKAGGWATLYKYTGKELDEQIGMYDYGARFYDPSLSLWTSVDPLADHPRQVSYNPYHYTHNNPVNYTDPDGKIPIPLIVAGLWALAEVGMSAYDAYDTGKTILDPDKSATEKWTAGGLFVIGVFLPGGGYSQLDNVAKWGVKSTKAIKRVQQKAQDATNLLFGKNNKVNISQSGVSSAKEANAIGETIVGELRYSEGYGSFVGEKVLKNKNGEFKINYRGPKDKVNAQKYANERSYGADKYKQANLELYKKVDGEWVKQKNVHINVDDL